MLEWKKWPKWKVEIGRAISFMNGESDVLVAANHIESGLDTQNANTIFTDNANNFDCLICIKQQVE
jgi:RecG-like helicase